MLKMILPWGGVLLAWLALLNLAHSAPSNGLGRGYLPPPPSTSQAKAAPSCEVVLREVDREVEMEECETVEEENCVTSLVDVCEEQETEKCDSVVEEVCTSVEAGFVILTNTIMWVLMVMSRLFRLTASADTGIMLGWFETLRRRKFVMLSIKRNVLKYQRQESKNLDIICLLAKKIARSHLF